MLEIDAFSYAIGMIVAVVLVGAGIVAFLRLGGDPKDRRDLGDD